MKLLLALLLSVVTVVDAQIPRFDVTMSPADYSLLYTRDIFSDSTLPAVLSYLGTPWNNSKIKFKGHSTRYYPKKGYSVKVPSGNLFQGQGTVTFNAMYTDKSFLREKLVWDIFSDMGAVAPRANHAELAINGEPKWLFLFIDKPDKYFLAKRGLSVAPLYETSDNYILGDLSPQPDSLLKLYYDKSIGDVNDYSDLEQLIAALNNAPAASFADTVNKYFDVSSVLNWFAGNILTMMGDSYNKNYFLYRDTSKTSQQWSIIPWDYDLSFGRSGDLGMPYPASLLNDGFAYTFGPLSGPSNVLKDRWVSTPVLYNLLRLRVDTLLQTVFTPQRLKPKIDSLAALIGTDVGLDPDKWGTVDDFREHVDALKYYIGARRNYLLKTFVNPPSGEYNDVTLPVSQTGVPYDFVAYDGRQLATLAFTSMSGLDSVRVEAFPDSVPPGIANPAADRFVHRWLRITPYPASAHFSAVLQWMYQDVSSLDREVGKGVQNERLLRCWTTNGAVWNPLPSRVNGYANVVTIDSISEADCAAGKVFALKLSETYTQTWYRKPLTNWQRWYDAKFVDGQNGFVVGDHGSILRTTDGGGTWNEQSVGLSLPLHGLAIPSPHNIYVVGNNGACYTSVDSGKSWTKRDLGVTNDLLGVTFLDSLEGCMFGTGGRILKTTDGGGHWNAGLLDSTKPISAFAIVAHGVYIAFQESTLRRTVDGGLIWQTLGSGGGIVLGCGKFGSTVWAVGAGGLVRVSPNSGTVWQVINVPEILNLRAVHAVDSLHAYVAGDGGGIFYTADGGSNWFRQYTADAHDLYALAFTDSLHGFAVGNGGTILTTADPATMTEVKTSPPGRPDEFTLFQNYPNPFNPETRIAFRIPERGRALLQVFDVLGREVETLLDGSVEAGATSVSWNASSRASGVYFYRLTVRAGTGATRFSQTGKMLLIR